MQLTKKIFEQVRELIVKDAQDKPPGSPIDSEVGYARRFGVSRPTVRKAVEELIAIGFIKRVAGKGLVLVDTDEIPIRGKILIALPHAIGDGFLYRVIIGALEQANLLGYEYKLLGMDGEAERLEAVKRERLTDYKAAITCCYGDPAELELVDVLKDKGLPTLLIDNPMPESELACVMCNDFHGGYLMGQYLARKGHERIVNLSSMRPAKTIEQRDAGFFAALADAGIRYDTSLYIRCMDQVDAFKRRFTAEDIRSGRITAICSHTSLFIGRLSSWLQENDVRIYEDVSIVGYGDHPMLQSYGMSITSIEVPAEDMGRRAVQEINDAMMEKRELQDAVLDVWLEKRHTVRTLEHARTNMEPQEDARKDA